MCSTSSSEHFLSGEGVYGFHRRIFPCQVEKKMLIVALAASSEMMLPLSSLMVGIRLLQTLTVFQNDLVGGTKVRKIVFDMFQLICHMNMFLLYTFHKYELFPLFAHSYARFLAVTDIFSSLFSIPLKSGLRRVCTVAFWR